MHLLFLLSTITICSATGGSTSGQGSRDDYWTPGQFSREFHAALDTAKQLISTDTALLRFIQGKQLELPGGFEMAEVGPVTGHGHRPDCIALRSPYYKDIVIVTAECARLSKISQLSKVEEYLVHIEGSTRYHPVAKDGVIFEEPHNAGVLNTFGLALVKFIPTEDINVVTRTTVHARPQRNHAATYPDGRRVEE